MIRGTTPTEVFKVTNPSGDSIDLLACKQIWITMVDHKGREFTWDIERLTIDDDEKTISLTLTQEETLALAVGRAQIQLRFLTADDVAFASMPSAIMVYDVRKGGTIE